MSEDYYQLLRNHMSVFGVFSDRDWNEISSRFELEKRKKGELLLHDGIMATKEYLIMSGIVKSYEIDEEGKEYIIQFAKENYWVSDYYSFLFHMPATMNIECIENSVFMSLSYENREELCSRYVQLANFFRIKTSRSVVFLQKRILSLMKDSAEERYHSLIRKHPDLAARVPKKFLAAFLGVSKETLSRF